MSNGPAPCTTRPALQALRVTGVDAESFLQGQLSGDLRQLTPVRAQWSSWSSPKGRMLALPLLVRSGEAIDLWLPPGLIAPVQKRLKMFVLRAKVVVEDLGAARLAVGVLGPDAGEWLRSEGYEVPAAVRDVTARGAVQVVRFPGEPARFLLLGPPGALPASSADGGDWRRADIESGIPVVLPETQEKWVAQMANLDLVGGIGFEKGCYTGQEVVARLHYLGNLKRRMFRLRGEGEPPAPGSPVHVPGGDAQSVGEIVDAVRDGSGGFVASAVLQIAQAAALGAEAYSYS